LNDRTPAFALPLLDDPGQRFVWTIPLAVVVWIAVLIGFARVLEQSAPPAAEPTSVQARIVELSPEPAGLQGGAAAAAPVAKPAPVVHPHPHVAIHPRAKPKAKVPPRPVAPTGTSSPVAEAPTGTASPAAESPAAPTSSTVSKTGAKGVTGSAGSGGGAGLGSDTAGARAIYAPVPKIPDELREDAMEAVAVAHFKVGYDGVVDVVLAQPTSNPELNQLLLDTLKQWRFSPAIKNGIAISSEFDVRIPVTVQ
jgi:periplasmic protein TonB